MRSSWLLRVRWTLCLARRGLRGLAKVSAALCAFTIVIIFVLWDVDFEEVRDRYERFKVAMFAERSNKEFEPGSATTGATFEDRDEMGLVFVTGKQPVGTAFEYRWCYVRKSGGNDRPDQSVQLGRAAVIGGKPVAAWNSITSTQAQVFGIDAQALEAASRRACLLS